MGNRWATTLAAGALACTLAAPTGAAPAAAGKTGPAKAAAAKPGISRPGRTGPRGRGGALRVLEQASQRLGLNTGQKATIKKILADCRAEMKKIREGAGTAQEKRPRLQAARKAARQEIEAILTPEQRQKLRKIRAEAAAKGGKAGKKGAAVKGAPGAPKKIGGLTQF
jgi:Spy/CpxP family protein refolding chaperone